MGLRETIRNLAQTAIAAVGNIAVSSTYRVKNTASYDTSTGTVTSNDTDYTAVPVVFDDNAYMNLGIIDQPNLVVNSNERLFYVAQLDLSPTPKKGDELISLGITWQIVDIKTDPAEALWIFKGKKP
jgi:hypothetical protein